MKESDYIKQLELSNELLHQKLDQANATIDRVEAVRYEPIWVRVTPPDLSDGTVMFYYQLGDSLIGYVEYSNVLKEVRGTTKFSKFTCDNFEECQKLVEKDFRSYFLRYGK